MQYQPAGEHASAPAPRSQPVARLQPCPGPSGRAGSPIPAGLVRPMGGREGGREKERSMPFRRWVRARTTRSAHKSQQESSDRCCHSRKPHTRLSSSSTPLACRHPRCGRDRGEGLLPQARRRPAAAPRRRRCGQGARRGPPAPSAPASHRRSSPS